MTVFAASADLGDRLSAWRSDSASSELEEADLVGLAAFFGSTARTGNGAFRSAHHIALKTVSLLPFGGRVSGGGWRGHCGGGAGGTVVIVGGRVVAVGCRVVVVGGPVVVGAVVVVLNKATRAPKE